VKWILKFMVIALLICQGNNVFAFDPCHDHAVDHKPRADVIYDEAQVSVPDPVFIPLTIDLAQRYDLDIPESTEIKPVMGMMEIYKDGRILYDGRDISGDIKDKCDNERDSTKTATESKETKNGDNTNADGQFPGMVPIGDQGE